MTQIENNLAGYLNDMIEDSSYTNAFINAVKAWLQELNKKIMINALNGNFYFSSLDVISIEKLEPHPEDEGLSILEIGHSVADIRLKLKNEEAETIRNLLLSECNKHARNILSRPADEEMIEAARAE